MFGRRLVTSGGGAGGGGGDDGGTCRRGVDDAYGCGGEAGRQEHLTRVLVSQFSPR